ncbi:MAG: DNA polymerase III subunit gamma/tau [Endomicrobiaceae bacterium]|nr:DNA polymerase III subunit gamma/tau [Endomicrobiaceae bacterium]
MSYLVLARKFRPTTFDEVIGQDHISQTLKNAIKEDKVAHAYLFSGPRGTGKTTMARIFAKALNCKEGPTPEPCGKCQNCMEIAKNQSIDVMEIDAASNTGVDNIREIRENVKFGATSSKYKIYIIDEVHQLSTGAFNALLKTLEEPPEHVIFILATTEQHKVPITILSRCQKYRFRLLSTNEIAKAIKNIAQKDNFEIEDEALKIIINASGGSMRDALSLLDQAISATTGKITEEYIRNLIGLLPKEIISKTIDYIAQNDVESIMKICKKVYEDGYNVLQFARDLRDHLRQLMLFSINAEIADVSIEDKKLYDRQKVLFPISRFIRMGNLISKALEEMKWHDQPRMLLELYLLKMAEPYYNVAELIAKVNELGKQNISSISELKETKIEKVIVSEDKSPSVAVNEVSEPIETDTVVTMAESFDYDLMGLWKEIVAEFSRKHPMSAQTLKDATVKEINANSFQIAVESPLSLNMIKMHLETIQKLMTRKSGREIKVSMVLGEISQKGGIIKEDIKIEPEEQPSKEKFVVVEDFKETAKTAVPSKIESIAKKFGGTAVKKEKIGSASTDNEKSKEGNIDTESEE